MALPGRQACRHRLLRLLVRSLPGAGPVLDELAAKYGEEIYVYKIDVDSEQELAAVFSIRSIPTLLFIPTEGNPRMVTGMQPKNVLEQQIREILPAR